MLIDSHQHFWRLDRPEVTWPGPDLPGIYRDFEAADLWRDAEGCGLSGSILVQSQESDADTDWLLEIAAADPRILAVVGWVDLASPGASARIARLASTPKFRGLRPMLQGLEDPNWITRADLSPALDAMRDNCLTLDALVRCCNLPALLAFARQWPEIRIVIDHGAKPPFVEGNKAYLKWADLIAQLAEFPQIMCKLSGLLTELRPDQHDDAVAPAIAHLVGCFGNDRLMWGSDWPVLHLRGDYRSWLDQAVRLTGLKGSAVAGLLGVNAQTFYRLGQSNA